MNKFKDVKLLIPHVIHLHKTNIANIRPKKIDDDEIFVQHFASTNGAHIVSTAEIVEEPNLMNVVWKISMFVFNHPFVALMIGLCVCYSPSLITKIMKNRGQHSPPALHQTGQQTIVIPGNLTMNERMNIINNTD
jgi:hypothetical protein